MGLHRIKNCFSETANTGIRFGVDTFRQVTHNRSQKSSEVVGGNEMLDNVISAAERFATSSKYVLDIELSTNYMFLLV